MRNWKMAGVYLPVAAVLDGRNIAEGKAFNKKDASQIAAQVAVEKLGIVNADSIGEEQGGQKKEP
jgi:ribonuclease-3